MIFVCSIDNKQNPHTQYYGSQNSIAEVEHIKRQIDRENIGFVRFEATDLHGVSRSKTVPASLFHVNTNLYQIQYLVDFKAHSVIGKKL